MKPRIKLGHADTITVVDPGKGAIDSVALSTLTQTVRFYGMRNVIFALATIADARAETSVELYNTVQAKQWAAWAVALEALRDNRQLTDPGRE